MQQVQRVVGHQFVVAFEEAQCFLVIAQFEEGVGLRDNAFRVLRVYGNGKFAAGDGGSVVFRHELGRSQCGPIGLGVRVVVEQFVEQPFCLFVFAYSEQCTGHQFLKVVAIVVRQT